MSLELFTERFQFRMIKCGQKKHHFSRMKHDKFIEFQYGICNTLQEYRDSM